MSIYTCTAIISVTGLEVLDFQCSTRSRSALPAYLLCFLIGRGQLVAHGNLNVNFGIKSATWRELEIPIWVNNVSLQAGCRRCCPGGPDEAKRGFGFMVAAGRERFCHSSRLLHRPEPQRTQSRHLPYFLKWSGRPLKKKSHILALCCKI